MSLFHASISTKEIVTLTRWIGFLQFSLHNAMLARYVAMAQCHTYHGSDFIIIILK